MQKPAQIRLFVVLACGILAVSTASILIRSALDDGVPPLVIAAYRLSFAALILSPLVLRSRRAELRRLTGHDWRWALFSGFFLALHFAAWISSLDYTTVTSSVVLVTTAPIWVALASWLIWRERLTRPVVIGLIIAVLGGMLVGLSDSSGMGLVALKPGRGTRWHPNTSTRRAGWKRWTASGPIVRVRPTNCPGCTWPT